MFFLIVFPSFTYSIILLSYKEYTSPPDLYVGILPANANISPCIFFKGTVILPLRKYFGSSIGHHPILNFEITSGDIILDASPAYRTQETAKAFANGVLTRRDNFVHTNEDLKNLSGLVNVVPFLGYSDSYRYNEKAYAEKDDGGATYNAHWINNPNETEYKGQIVTPFRDIMADAKKYLTTLAEDILSINSTRLRIVASHSGIVEALMFHLVNSGSAQPIQVVEEIGDVFNMEESFLLTSYYNINTNEYSVLISRDKFLFPVNLENFRKIA